MMPLGLDAAQYAAYVERLFNSHDFAVDIDVLHLDERMRGRIEGEFIDGQVNLQRESIRRSLTLSLYDPDHALAIDADSPFDGALYLDRLVRVRHTLDVPGVGSVTAIPFVGPITKLSREGSVLTIEGQDKAALAVNGRPPMRRKKGANAVAAIRAFMQAAGERRFRFRVPASKARRRLPRDYSIGWTAEASPWAVCRIIANNVLGMELEYSCDGALVLRNRATEPVLTYATGSNVVGGIKVDYDASTVRNHVRVSGQIPAKKRKKGKSRKARKFTVTATAPSSHPMSPGGRRNGQDYGLARNGSRGYLPLLVDDTAITSKAKGRTRARRELNANLPMTVTTSWSGVPVFHLDYGDPIRLDTPDGAANTRYEEVSIPLGLGGDGSIGIQRRVSRPRRTGRRAR